jgi:hypothetical protein
MRKRIALPAFLPDQSSNSGVLLEAEGVYPRVDGYGPVGAFASLSDALPAAFKGGQSFIADDGTSTLLVGTATGLVKYAAGAWTDLVTGMSVSGQWRFFQFGNFAVGLNGVTTKVINLTAGTAGNLAGAPNGIAGGVVGDYAVIVQGSNDLLGVYTSGFNDHTDWNPAGTGGATIQPMLTGGECMGFIGGEYGVILQRQRIVRMSRTGDDLAPFSYDEITPNVGCASKGSVATAGRSVFFLSDRGFMALEDGQALKPIGSEKVDRWFQGIVPRDDYERMFSAVDPQNKLVVWCIPGSPGFLLIYNFELDRWATAEMPIDGIFAGFTSSQTLEEVAVTYPDLDAMPISLDDPRWSGGNPRLYAVSGSVGTLTGPALKASFQMGFNEFNPGMRSRVREVTPITDAIAGLTLEIDARARMGDAPAKFTATTLRGSGAMPIRVSGRYQKPRLEIAAGTLWTYVQGLEIDVAAGGER